LAAWRAAAIMAGEAVLSKCRGCAPAYILHESRSW
jgi:hypothetical protein